MFLILLRKSPVSLIYESPSCITGLRWWSKNSETFSVGVPQFEITGLPGTSYNLLWILGRRYIFPRLVVFLYLYVKCWSSFSDIIPLAFKDLKKMIAFFYKFRKYFVFKLNTLINILIAKLDFCFLNIVVSIPNDYTRSFVSSLYHYIRIISQWSCSIPLFLWEVGIF